MLAQTAKPHEIILLDNASTDGSVEIARKFPSVRLMALEQNTGFARGNNLAIEAASKASEWIALINPDAFAEPRWLEALWAAAEANPEFDVFGSTLLDAADSSLLDGAGDACHISGLVWRTAQGAPVSVAGESECEIFSRWMLDAGCWMLDAGCWMLDAGCWMLEQFGRAEGEGIRFIRSEIAYLARHAPWLIPEAGLRTPLKYLGYRIGRSEQKLSTAWKRRLSMQPGFWRGDTADSA